MTHETLKSDSILPREIRNTRTRPALWDALLSLLEEKGFDQISVREITGRAEIGYTTFFRHYPDKEALLSDLAERQIGTLIAMTLPILYTVDNRATSQALCAYVWEHRKVWKVLLTGGAASVLKEESIRQAQKLAMNYSRPNAFVPSDLRVVVPIAGTIEIFAWWLKQNDPPSVQRMAELVDTLIITPITMDSRDVDR